MCIYICFGSHPSRPRGQESIPREGRLLAQHGVSARHAAGAADLQLALRLRARIVKALTARVGVALECTAGDGDDRGAG